jgi:hypothetical protein
VAAQAVVFEKDAVLLVETCLRCIGGVERCQRSEKESEEKGAFQHEQGAIDVTDDP